MGGLLQNFAKPGGVLDKATNFLGSTLQVAAPLANMVLPGAGQAIASIGGGVLKGVIKDPVPQTAPVQVPLNNSQQNFVNAVAPASPTANQNNPAMANQGSKFDTRKLYMWKIDGQWQPITIGAHAALAGTAAYLLLRKKKRYSSGGKKRRSI